VVNVGLDRGRCCVITAFLEDLKLRFDGDRYTVECTKGDGERNDDV
jgi:hypothetical protein